MKSKETKNDLPRNVSDYIALIERTNRELLDLLGQCINLLENLKPLAPNANNWDETLEAYRKAMASCESIEAKKPYP